MNGFTPGMPSRRLRVVWMAKRPRSQAMQRQLSFSATAAVVPEPQKQSRTVFIIITGACYNGVKGEGSSRIEWGIDVDQIDFAGELGEERGEDVLFAAPD